MITVNGVDLASLGVLARTRAALPLGGRARTTVAIPGGYPLLTGDVVQPGTLTVSGTLRVPRTGDPDADHALLLTRLDQLVTALQGEQVLRVSDYPDREWVGYLSDASQLALHDPQWVQRSGALSLEWTVPDPRARAQVETVQSGPGALVLGTAPTPLRIEAAAASAITARVRAGGAAGTILAELVWSGASGAVVIDADGETLTVDGANAIDGITAGSVFPVADPAAGADYVEVPAGITVRFRRRWW